MARYKKGECGNPNGRPKLPKDIKLIRNYDQYEVERQMNKLLHMTPLQLKTLLDEKKEECMEVLLASILYKAIFHGDERRAEFFLNRLIGKVTENIRQVSPLLTIIERPDGGETILAAEMGEGKKE